MVCPWLEQSCEVHLLVADEDKQIEPRVRRTAEQLHAQAEAVVESVASLAKDVEQFPRGIDEAKLQLALQGLDAALAAPLSGSNMTRDQLAAAVLLGRGMTYADAARALGVNEGQLYYWSRTVPGFRHEMAEWREKLEEDIEARLYSSIAALHLTMDSMTDTDKIRLMGLEQKIAAKPEDRARWAAEYQLKKEALEIQRAQMEREKAAQEEDDPRVTEVIDNAASDIYEGMYEVDEAGEADL